MVAWACARCDTLHTQNPGECRNCGHGIFRPVSDSELQSRSRGEPTPVSQDIDLTAGTTPELEVGRSPDVNPDGSIKLQGGGEEQAQNKDQRGATEAIINRLSSLLP